MIPDHVLSMVVFSVLVALFFATVNHRDRAGFWKSAAKTFGWMALGSVAFAWLMYWTA
jgi:uncharacterized membrane protein